jgi:hypothetical protein
VPVDFFATTLQAGKNAPENRPTCGDSQLLQKPNEPQQTLRPGASEVIPNARLAIAIDAMARHNPISTC